MVVRLVTEVSDFITKTDNLSMIYKEVWVFF